MSKSLVFVVAAASALVWSQLGVAENPSFRADRKITGDFFRPHTAGAYYQGAIGHAETLDYYARRYSAIPMSTVQEHATEIRRNLDAASEEVSKLGQEAQGDKQVESHLKAIQEHHAKAAELSNKLTDKSADAKTLAGHSNALAKELKAVELENEKLKKLLGGE